MNDALTNIFGAIASAPASVNRLVTTASSVETEAKIAAAKLEAAIKVQLALQAIATAGVLYLCYRAWKDSQKGV